MDHLGDIGESRDKADYSNGQTSMRIEFLRGLFNPGWIDYSCLKPAIIIKIYSPNNKDKIAMGRNYIILMK